MDPSAILIVRTSALGDVVHALPVLSALGRTFPESRIGWVVEDVFAPLVADHPSLDEVIPVRLRRWRGSWSSSATRKEARRAWRRIRGFGAQVAIDLMGNHKGGFLTRCSGAPLRIGAHRAERREALSHLWINSEQPLAGEHAVDRGLSLLTPLGISTQAVDFAPSSCIPRLADSAAALRRRHPVPYVLIQPGAGWENKRYAPERWGYIARKLREDGHDVLVLAGPGEESLAQRVIDTSGGSAVLAVGPGMEFLVGVLRGARLLLGGDTGPLHLGHALGVPVLAVMGPTDPRRHGPYGAPGRSLVEPLPCSYCSKRLSGTRACLDAIPAEYVLAAARRQLAIPPRREAP